MNYKNNSMKVAYNLDKRVVKGLRRFSVEMDLDQKTIIEQCLLEGIPDKYFENDPFEKE